MSTDLRNRIIIFFFVLVAAIVFLLPTVFREAFSSRTWVSGPISLGLDLSGGVHLAYDVQTKEAVKSRLQTMGNGIRSALRAEKVPVVKVGVNQSDQVEVTLLNDRSEQKARDSITQNYKELSFVEKQSDDGERIKLVYGISAAQAQRIEDESVGQSIETLRNRVDQFGVSEPLIQKVAPGRHRDSGVRTGRLASVGSTRCRCAATEGAERKSHARDCGPSAAFTRWRDAA